MHSNKIFIFKSLNFLSPFEEVSWNAAIELHERFHLGMRSVVSSIAVRK